MPTRARRRAALALAAVSFVLLPWTVWLLTVLPHHYRTAHWRMAWVGFDVALACAAATTAFAIARRPGWVRTAATVTGTLLLCDAWFDVLLASTNGEVLDALVEAAIGEVPVAALCFWVAHDSDRHVVRSVTDALRSEPGEAGAPER